MYQGRGLGQPYVMGLDGRIADCSSLSDFSINCLSPFAYAHPYSMLDYTTQSDLGPAASPATVAAVAADTQSTIQQQCADDPADCAIASSYTPVLAAAAAGAQQAVSDATSLIPAWLWAVLIGGGLLLAMATVRR
jgi:hypothetical protein